MTRSETRLNRSLTVPWQTRDAIQGYDNSVRFSDDMKSAEITNTNLRCTRTGRSRVLGTSCEHLAVKNVLFPFPKRSRERDQTPDRSRPVIPMTFSGLGRVCDYVRFEKFAVQSILHVLCAVYARCSLFDSVEQKPCWYLILRHFSIWTVLVTGETARKQR